MEHGKDLPPITLSKTSISYLVTLIPVLVSMTSQGEVPSYEDDTDKPAWWPEDVQWRNPKTYVQDGDKKQGEVLKVLRKLVHSCYSYHGVEDLLCRLEETSSPSDSEVEVADPADIMQLTDGMDQIMQPTDDIEEVMQPTDDIEEIMQLTDDVEEAMQPTDDIEEGLEESSAESEGPVFVCCFCLDQFNSHEEVNTHQNLCPRRFKENSTGNEKSHLLDEQPEQMEQDSSRPEKTEQDSSTRSQSPLDIYVESFLEPREDPSSAPNEPSDFLRTVMSTSSEFLTSCLSFTSSSSSSSSSWLTSSHSSPHISTFLTQVSSLTHITTTTPQPSTPAAKRSAPSTSYPFVPTLKTRSQKKLDQIMEKHTLRRLMIQECQQMKDIPETGAWWVRKKKQKSTSLSAHPENYLSQDAFASCLGLAKKADVEAKVKAELGVRKEQEVDLDCQIVSVEGPLSAVPAPPPDRQSSSSPRSAMSLISQLSRDSEANNSRRRLSFCFVDDEWADKEALEEGRDPLQISLLTLDFSSPLGQRVRKYVKGEGHMNIIKDPENYCKTEDHDDSYSKLRFRSSDYRITFRKKRRASNFVHKYKFNCGDRLEFQRLLKTGLSAHSRRLKRCLPQCRVVLTRVTEAEIKFWTEEKKITISEKIIYDDDICITQIEIPESKVAQGFTSDRPVPSQHHLYRPASHPHSSIQPSSIRPSSIRPSSTMAIRTSLSLTSSPPHIPNIFRNRSTHTPSPPRPGSSSSLHSLKSAVPPHFSKDKMHKVEGHGACTPSSRPLFRLRPAQHTVPGKISPSPASHLSGHKVLTPSAYSSGMRGLDRGHSLDRGLAIPTSNGVDRHSSVPVSNSNRRKQQLTHVRRDDGEGAGTHKSSISTSKGFVPLGSPGTNPFSKSSTSTSDTQLKRMSGNDPSSRTLTSSVRKLSNFDYYSIRDGKIRASELPVHTSLLSYQPDRHQEKPQHSQQLSHQRQHTSQKPWSSSSSPSSASAHTQRGQGQQKYSHSMSIKDRPSTVIHYGPSLHQHEQTDGSPRSPSNSTRPSHVHTLKEVTARTPALMEHLHRRVVLPSGIQAKVSAERRKLNGDDEVMEVICIDDD